MGWKDSGDAVMYPDGTLVRGPKALCELQGYVYDAWRRMAQMFDALGDDARAAALRGKAPRCSSASTTLFWDEASGYYAYCLDGDKKQVLSVASNPGHCLWSGIVPPDRAARVVARLMAPDMWSGWGIRTLSAEHRSFNPYAYQLGAVWPHDNSIIALGFKRYGFAAEAARSRATSAGRRATSSEPVAGALCRHPEGRHQLPGAVSRRQRAAGLGGGIGLHAAAGDAGPAARCADGRLFIDPALPEWLPEVTLPGPDGRANGVLDPVLAGRGRHQARGARG